MPKPLPNSTPKITEVGSKEQLQKVLTGDYELPVQEAIKTAFRLSLRSIHPLLPAALMILAVAFLVVSLAGSWFGPLMVDDTYTSAFFYTAWALRILLAPLVGGLIWLGIKLAGGQQAKVKDMFDALPRALPLMLLATITTTIGIVIGSLLKGFPMAAVLVEMVISVFTIAAVPLLLTYKISVLNALYYSVLLVKHQFFKFFMLYVVVFAFIFISLLTLGIGFIITVPFIFILHGVVYSYLFGLLRVNSGTNSNDQQPPDSNDWSA
ncbi:hypothetical protein SAMN06297229_1302 [Pseudidiomarina planktonica]|uniref:Uncharacterized protein n=1 Tax=Pseudidiomarina planktonica TaxID=1323738 RepID=A0A1Y6ES92_9GAMM|nr:hypothetical protein [Pseudidiomarina planktonica]RUO65306.1 hypothetical protein CWI77_02265 [Pseudidiomarina planktonica]SMQ65574.1 hypothetical protein SAMN06297229_1302 [Pseudidiomarina planktonica]